MEWARAVLSETVERVRRECADAGRADVWGVFDARVLGPILGDREPVSYRELVAQLGLPSCRRLLTRLLRQTRSLIRCQPQLRYMSTGAL